MTLWAILGTIIFTTGLFMSNGWIMCAGFGVFCMWLEE